VDVRGNVLEPIEEHLVSTEPEDEGVELKDKPVPFDVNGMEGHVPPKLNEFVGLDAKMEKLMWHYRLGHAPFSTINRLAAAGELPKRPKNVKDPMCASCMYGMMTRRPWRTKTSPTQVQGGRSVLEPGDCVSVDQMQSPVPGHIAQVKGHPTKERYTAATVFVDHYSDVTFVHLQKTLNAKDTIEAKEAFERWARSCGTTINHYHADNGRFAETNFMAHVARMGQTITFCGVNAQFSKRASGASHPNNSRSRANAIAARDVKVAPRHIAPLMALCHYERGEHDKRHGKDRRGEDEDRALHR
jgi:GAG-pre-integrase domain